MHVMSISVNEFFHDVKRDGTYSFMDSMHFNISDDAGEFIAVAESNTTLDNSSNSPHNYGIHTIPFRVSIIERM